MNIKPLMPVLLGEHLACCLPSLSVPFCHHPSYLEMPFSLRKFLIIFTIFSVAVALQIYPCVRHSNEQLPYFNLYELCTFCAFKGRHGQEIAVEIYDGEK